MRMVIRSRSRRRIAFSERDGGGKKLFRSGIAPFLFPWQPAPPAFLQFEAKPVQHRFGNNQPEPRLRGVAEGKRNLYPYDLVTIIS